MIESRQVQLPYCLIDGCMRYTLVFKLVWECGQSNTTIDHATLSTIPFLRAINSRSSSSKVRQTKDETSPSPILLRGGGAVLYQRYRRVTVTVTYPA
jgi:hypothetical protein